MKFRKILAVISALCMMCAVLPVVSVQNIIGISVSAEEETEYVYENFKYTKSEEYVSITGYVEKPAGELVIPAEIDGLPVKFIGQGAFEYCEDITSLTLPDTLTSIASNAFECVQRTNPNRKYAAVRTASDENSIQTSAFYNCIGLKEIHVSDTNPGLSSADGILFNKDKTEIIRYPAEKEGDSYSIPETVTKIARGAFSGSAGLVSVVIPDSVNEIEGYAFRYCTALTSVVIPEGVTDIKSYTFHQCTSLTSVTVPESVSGIGHYVFNGTPWLETMETEHPLFIINHVLVSGKNAKGDIIIPDGVTDIIGRAFANNTEMTSVFIPESVTNIVDAAGTVAFLTCSALTKIEVSENNPVYASEDGVLFNKKKEILIQYPVGNSRTEYTIPDGVQIIADSAFYNAKNLTSVTIPEGVAALEARSFYGCSGLVSVTIPKSVESIGGASFNRCTVLKSVVIQNPECKFYDRTFSNEGAEFSGTLYVPEGSEAQVYAEKYYSQNFSLISSEPETTEAKEFTPGDADGSGKVDILDVITINKAILGKETLTAEQLKAADINQNDKPDAADSLAVMKLIVGLITDLTA